MMTLCLLRCLYPHSWGLGSRAVFTQILPLLPPPPTQPSGSRAVNQHIRRSVFPWLLLLRLSPAHTNLHSRAEAASLN